LGESWFVVRSIDHSPFTKKEIMKVHVYAVLKDHFDAAFDIPETVFSVEELKQALVRMRPAAEGILRTCRFAVNDTFIDNEFKLSKDDRIAVLPPASGG
jgi:molybdopterin synthase sulfur carrier subunit